MTRPLMNIFLNVGKYLAKFIVCNVEHNNNNNNIMCLLKSHPVYMKQSHINTR